MKTLRSLHGTLRVGGKPSPTVTILSNNDGLYHISNRHKVPNPRYSRSRQQVDKMDFKFKNYGQFDQSGHEDLNYENLDYTLPESEFLKDVDQELIKNTYIEYNNHWMKNFIRFTDAEFESFNTRKPKQTDEEFDSIKTESTGYARIPDHDVDEISESLQYLDEWKKNLKERKMEDDYQVKLPNGSIIPYREYLQQLSASEQQQGNKRQQRHTPQQIAGIQRHMDWHKKEPVHDEYGMFLCINKMENS